MQNNNYIRMVSAYTHSYESIRSALKISCSKSRWEWHSFIGNKHINISKNENRKRIHWNDNNFKC